MNPTLSLPAVTTPAVLDPGARTPAVVAAAALAPALLALPTLPPAIVPSGMEPRCRVGVDVTSIDEVAEALAAPRYLERVYTDHERACCTGAPAVVAAGLAARFAAKEAVVKVLRPVGPRPPWRSIEVRRIAGGACELALSGAARELADEAGIAELTVSLTHEGPWAAAVVVALCDDAAEAAERNDATDRRNTDPRNTDRRNTDRRNTDRRNTDRRNTHQGNREKSNG